MMILSFDLQTANAGIYGKAMMSGTGLLSFSSESSFWGQQEPLNWWRGGIY
jgi:hypothetical protein